MNVGELIKELEKFNPKTNIFIGTEYDYMSVSAEDVEKVVLYDKPIKTKRDRCLFGIKEEFPMVVICGDMFRQYIKDQEVNNT